MDQFISRFAGKIIGALRCFDRILIRGTLMPIMKAAGMAHYLHFHEIPPSRWGDFLSETSQQVRTASVAVAARYGRPILEPPSGIRKEDFVQQIATRDRITDGYICGLKCQESGKSFRVSGGVRKPAHIIDSRPPSQHLYHYLFHPELGLIHVRLQTWFPFAFQVVLNGHEWLARALDHEGIDYVKNDNSFPWIEDFDRAQRIADSFSQIPLRSMLSELVREFHPRLPEVLGSYPASYFWSAFQTEYSTDLVFASAQDLARIYPSLVQHAITVFGSNDVLRFLGRRPNRDPGSEISSRFKDAVEGVRIRHSVGTNSVKIYDKDNPLPVPVLDTPPTICRVESTINEAKDFRVLRPANGDPHGKESRRIMRQTIDELPRRTIVHQGINDRYLDALASTQTDTPVGELIGDLARPVQGRPKKGFRGFRAWAATDLRLFAAVSRGEFTLHGFRNNDIKAILFESPTDDPRERRRRTAYVSRLIRLLRAHRLAVKIARSRRYTLTKHGRDVLTALLSLQPLTLMKIQKIAA